jgi:ketosteroid isomerase-like protein
MKKISILILTCTLAGMVSTGCVSNNNPPVATAMKDSSTSFDVAAMQKTVDEKNIEFAKAFTTGDSAGMVNHYAPDGKIFPPNASAVAGRSAIAALVSEYMTFGIKEFHDSTTALYGNGDNLIEEGTFYMGDGKGHTIDKGKYIAVWRKVDGEWKVYSNMFNTSLPAAPAKK